MDNDDIYKFTMQLIIKIITADAGGKLHSVRIICGILFAINI